MANPQPDFGVHVAESSATSYKLEHFCVPRCYEQDLAAILVPHGLIVERVHKIAQMIHDDVGNAPLTVLCVLKGSYRFFTALVQQLGILRHNCDHPLIPDFIRVRSYCNEKSTGEVDIIGWEHLCKLEGENVLVVEDLIDTGLTMQKLVNKLLIEKPKSLRVATMAVKRTKGVHGDGYTPDYVGFSLPDEFVVGYGLDYNQKFRDFDHIGVLNKAGVERHKV